MKRGYLEKVKELSGYGKDHYDFLTESERNAEKDKNEQVEWAYGPASLQKLAKIHREAREKYESGITDGENELKTMIRIEYRLNDANFHSEAGWLESGDYDKAGGSV